jgi:stage II sporulation protein AA (anti-sigma F factor antagonist)
MSGQELVKVEILGLPIEIWQQASAHHEAIQRELEIIRASEPPDSVPNRLFQMIELLQARFGDAGDPTWEELRATSRRGKETANLAFHLPAEIGEAAVELGTMLDEVDRFCLEGERLMTLATPPELVRFREWFLGEFDRQVGRGEEPVGWEDYRDRFEAPATPSQMSAPARSGSGSIVFEGSLDLSTAGELRERILEKRSEGVAEIVVDLSGVGFVDSVGIGLLLTTQQRLQEEGVSMRLVVPPRIKELLRLTGVDDLLDPEDPPTP